MATLVQSATLLNAKGNPLSLMFIGGVLQYSAVVYLEAPETANHANRFELACKVLLDGQVETIAEKFYRIGMCYDNIASVGDAAQEPNVTTVITNHYNDVANRLAVTGV